MPIINDPALDDPLTKAIADDIVQQRGSLLQLYRTLLHSPPVAQGWLALLTGVRQKSTLPGALRELVILRIAQLNQAQYEYDQHLPIAIECGVSSEKIDALSSWRSDSERFTALELDVLALTDEVTLHARPKGDEIVRLRSVLTERQLVELAVTIAAYNMVSRFLETMQIH